MATKDWKENTVGRLNPANIEFAHKNGYNFVLIYKVSTGWKVYHSAKAQDNASTIGVFKTKTEATKAAKKWMVRN